MPIDPNAPSGFDRADGQGDRLGTPTPASAIRVQGYGSITNIDDMPFEEFEDSPEIERAEQATLTHRFKCSWIEAINRLSFLGRGTLLIDSYENITKILSSRIQRQKGGWATLTIVSEGVSFDSPPDQFQVTPVELGLNIIKHPRYFYAFLGDGYGSATELQNQMVIRRLQDYFENPTAAFRDAITFQLYYSLGYPGSVSGSIVEADPAYEIASGPYAGDIVQPIAGTEMAKRAAIEIVQKYWRGEEQPYIVGWQIEWSRFYFRPQYLNPGGYIENPMTEASPQLPNYFSSPDYPPSDTNTIFNFLSYYNPQSYSADGAFGGDVNISWLRKADKYDYERTWFRVDRTWVGSAVGYWDTELYNNGDRPSVPDDYVLTQPSLQPSAVAS